MFSQVIRRLAENRRYIRRAISPTWYRRHEKLLTTLINLFTSSPVKSGHATRVPQEKVAHNKKVKPDPRPDGISTKEMDAAFYGLILGVQSPIDSHLNDFEKSVLRELDKLLSSDISRSNLVPRLPAVIPRIMGTLRDQSSSSADLASQIGRDAVLVSEVIRLANSPYYRVGQKITSLESAVFVLGQVGVRQLVTNVTLRPLINLSSGHFTKLSVTTLWEQSEKTAVACDCMARQARANRFNAYLMAIVQNVGFTVALQILDHHFDGSQAPRSELFHERLISRSRELSWVIAREWKFPSTVLEALESQIDGKNMQTLGNILYAGDKLSKIHILSTRGRFEGKIDPVVNQLQGCLTDACRVCYEALSDEQR